MLPLAVSAYTAVSAIGRGRSDTLAALQARRSGLRPCDFEGVQLDTWIGRVQGIGDVLMPPGLERFDCRNNRLAQMALATDGFADAVRAAAEQYGPERIAVVLGTSTSGILSCEHAYRRRDPAAGTLPVDFDYEHTHDLFSLARFVRGALGLQGPASVVSTACSSAAKTFGEAAELLAAGVCDAAVVGGVDSLCGMTLYGFGALELLARGPSRPFAADRGRHFDRRSCRLSAPRAAGADATESDLLARLRRQHRCAPHVDTASGGPGRNPGDGGGAGIGVPVRSRHRLRELSRHGHQGQ